MTKTKHVCNDKTPYFRSEICWSEENKLGSQTNKTITEKER